MASGTAATNYSTWVSNTRLQVIGMKNFYTAYNAVANASTVAVGELSTDGYSSAYTEVKGKDPAEASTYTGKCTDGTGGTKVPLGAGTTPTFSISDWDDTATMTIAFETDATADADIGAASDTGGASVCAMKCSTLTYWGFDPASNTTNLPFTYLPDAVTGTLTSTDAAATAATLGTMTVASCIGFEVGATGVANNTDQLTCDLYYGAFPTGNTT
jgi:hypothetical protein